MDRPTSSPLTETLERYSPKGTDADRTLTQLERMQAKMQEIGGLLGEAHSMLDRVFGEGPRSNIPSPEVPSGLLGTIEDQINDAGRFLDGLVTRLRQL